MSKLVLSIDVGLLHLGLSLFEISEAYEILDVVWVDMVDITQYTHRTVNESECLLFHTKTISDWIDHFIQENEPFFSADVILIERQPHGAFVAIEQLLFSRFRRKEIYLISPRSVHAYLHMTSLDYDKRKEWSVLIATRVLPERFRDQLLIYPRSHDIADSVCQFLYWRNREATVYREKMRRKRWMSDSSTVFEKLESFRY